MTIRDEKRKIQTNCLLQTRDKSKQHSNTNSTNYHASMDL